MRLLICTQIVDSQDSNLGFFHRWIEEFARHCEKVTVICLTEGAHVFPGNVKVLSLGKEAGTSKVTRAIRFWKYIYQERDTYDAVFVHMNPEYVLLGGFLWKRWGKKVGLWYAHKSVTRKLKRAVSLVDRVFTVSEDSFGLHSPKVTPVGHGIDTDLFNPTLHLESTATRILTVGRVAESKHLIEMLEMLDTMEARGERFTFTIVGIPTSEAEEAYAQRLYDEAKTKLYSDRIRFLGSVPHHELPALLNTHDLALNFSTTGNMDKAGLEALAVGIPLFTTNQAFEALLEPYGLYTPTMAGETAAGVLMKFLNRSDRPSIVATLRNRVAAEHSLKNLIPKILAGLS